MPDEQIDVVVVPDPEGGTQEPQVQKTGEDEAVADLKQQIEALKTDRAQADSRAAQAVRDAEQARQDAQAARTAAQESDANTIAVGIDAAKSRVSTAIKASQAALENGDFAKVAELQAEISEATSELTFLKQSQEVTFRKQSLADSAVKPKAAAEAPQQPRQAAPSGDQVEAFIASRTEPTQNWLRKNREWVADQRKSNRLTAAHYNALGEGLVPDTPQYFEHVEQFLGIKEKPVAQQPKQEAPREASEVKPNGQQPPRRSPPPAAPVNNGGAGGSSSPMRVELTKGEAASATDGTLVWNYNDPNGKFKKGDPIGIQEMARRKSIMKSQGVYDRTYTDQ